MTGGASGLWEATTRAVTAEGVAVTILDLQEDRGQALAAELGRHTTFVRTDVTDEASVQAAIAYAASEGGVVGMTLPAAHDLSGVGIRVCTIAPGLVDTPMVAGLSEEARAGLSAGIPFPKRLARPSDYAELTLDVVRHGYLDGEVIRMDGALRMAPR